MKMRRFTQALLLFLVVCVGALLKTSPAQAASYVECGRYRTQAGNYYIWVDSDTGKTIKYATSESGTAKTLVKAKSGTSMDNCISNGSTVFYVNYVSEYGSVTASYIYKYNISSSKKTLLKKTTGVQSLLGYCSSTKTLYMQKYTSSGSKIVGLNMSTGKLVNVITGLSEEDYAFGMSGKYIIYSKSGKLYSYNVSSKSKKLISSKIDTSTTYDGTAVVSGNAVYYMEKTGESAPLYIWRLRKCSISGGAKKTLKSNLSGLLGGILEDTADRLILAVYDFGYGGNAGTWYYYLATGQFVATE